MDIDIGGSIIFQTLDGNRFIFLKNEEFWAEKDGCTSLGSYVLDKRSLN